MALSFFEVERGFLHNNAAMIAGAGAPPGTGDSASVGIGSIWQDTTSGDFYVKRSAGSGAEKWVRLALESEIGSGGWREPVTVVDSTSTTIPTGTPGNPITIDGVQIDDGERVLFTAITDTTKQNVWIYNQSTGQFVEDSNQESAGDIVYVISGTNAGKTFAYSNAGTWVLSNSSDLAEQGYIRAFIGKNAAGNELPTYSTTNYVSNGDNLETAVGKLDTQLKTTTDSLSAEITNRTNADATLQGEIDAIETGAGLNANGTYSANLGSNYISTASSLKNADDLLDAQLKSVSNSVASLSTAVSQNTSLLAAARTENTTTSITSSTAVDSVLTKDAVAAKWTLYVEGTATGDKGNRQAIEILAMHNGTTTVDATTVDYNQYAKLKLGTITGFAVTITLTGTGATQAMNLVVNSGMAVDVRTIREVIKF